MKSPKILLIIVSLFFSLSISAQKNGDVNGDRTVDISDVVAVINTIAGNCSYRPTSDVNNDTKTDISDIVAIINIIAYETQHDGYIRLSDLVKIIFNGFDMFVVNCESTKNYKLTEGLELSLTTPSTNADNHFLNIYSAGEIVASLSFSDADKISLMENGLLNFWFNDKIIHQTNVSNVDSIVVYDRSKEPFVYLGIMGFNQELYEKNFGVLDKNTVDGYKSFISSLTTNYGTTLYFAVDNALDRIISYNFVTPIKSVNLITFTDGLDQGSHALNEKYETDENYLNHLKSRISKTQVSGLPITAYSLGLRGDDVTDYNQFRFNLYSIASSNANAFETTSISEVNNKLDSIADDIISRITTVTQKVAFTIPATGKGTKVRIVLDGKSAENSIAYIEGIYQPSDKSLHEVILKGVASGGTSSLDVLTGTAKGIFLTYSVADISADFTLTKSNIRQYNMPVSSSIWQINSEFNPESDVLLETKTTYNGTAVFLLLDCSSSMSSDFSNMKSYVNNFIAKVAANAKNERTIRPIDKSNINSNLALKTKNSDVMRLEVPHVRTGTGIYFVSHWAKMNDLATKTVMNYCFEYDSAWCHSRWVAFTFNDTTKVGSGSRSDAWSEDLSLPSACQLLPTSYSGSGYTRGHLCASADRLFSTQANQQTFYMSNMSPQLYNFNSYYWAELELLIRNWSKSSNFKKLYVCKGGTIKDGQRYPIGEGYFETSNKKGTPVKVAIPRYYFMAILAETKLGTYQSIGFLLEQHAGYSNNYPAMSQMKQHVMSIDELEAFTGIDFFCNLNDNLENQLETDCNVDAWSWN